VISYFLNRSDMIPSPSEDFEILFDSDSPFVLELNSNELSNQIIEATLDINVEETNYSIDFDYNYEVEGEHSN
jgi:hypothetical protein